MTEQSQWAKACLTRPINRTEWALSGKEEKQERLEAKSRMAVVLRQTRASAHVARGLQYLPAVVNTSKSNKRQPSRFLDWFGHHDNVPLRAAVAGEWGGFGEEYYD
jgi:hypothetical protein